MKQLLEQKIREAIQGLQEAGALSSFDIPEIKVEYPKDESFGEFTTNIALVLSKLAGKPPREIAESIKGSLNIEGVSSIEVAGPGHLNFVCADSYFRSVLTKTLSGEGILTKNPEKVLVEYSNPNTHKEFHIGHLRNVFIGNTLVNVMRKTGNEVIAANYIGDTGTHIGKCLWGLVTLYKDENFESIGNKAEFLGKVYSEAQQKIDENPENEGAFKALQKRFEAGDPELVALWEKTKQWSLDEFNRIYAELRVSFDVFFYESIEEEAGKKILPELLEKGIVRESEGAVIADLEADNLGVLVLVRSDGSALYGLKDIPLAKKKFEEYKIDRSIYVVDIRQSLYFKQLFKVLELYGFHKKMEHVGYEFVALKGGETMSSRKGNIIPAKHLIDDVVLRVTKQFPESPDAKSIALGAIRFAMLKHSGASKIEFDIEESVRLDGATGPYVQYAHARIESIREKAKALGFSGETANESISFHPKEKELVRELSKFPELVLEIAQTNEVHKLAHYALRIADKFHSFYSECKVINEEDKETTENRLYLVSSVQKVLKETLLLIGIAAPKRM